MRSPVRASCVFILCALFCPQILGAESASSPTISFESLLEEMIDRDQVARMPDPYYTCKQASSYDRDTVAKDQPGWFANWDRSQFVRVETHGEGAEYVLMDAEGPGAIVRFWATWHGPRGGPFSNGTLRVYLDHSTKPVIEGPAAEVISGGRVVGPPLSASVSPESPYAQRGHNLYLPIPYARHCKVTYETDVLVDQGGKQGEALYYQINYRTYAGGTKVRSLDAEQLKETRPLIARVQHRLMASGPWLKPATRCVQFHGPVSPGKSRSVLIEGPAAIRELSVNLEAKDREQALRSTILELSFDGKSTVWCPVGDFFGTGYRTSPYLTWYTRVTLDGTMSSFWVMPFERSCRVTLHNVGTQDVEAVLGKADYGEWEWCDRSLHFHSTWKQYTRIDTGPNKDMTGNGAFDANYVEVQGAGRYVGDTLTLFNGTDAWWGEGDEKIFVDGESFPSHIGTGSEDYYGYAWCKPGYFCMPFHAQPDGSGNLTIGFSVNSRYRSLDAIPFRESIRMDLELWHWRHTRMNYAPSTFWYARPGATWNVEPDPASAALPVARSEDDVVEVVRVPGAIEAESLRIVERTGGKTDVQKDSKFGWSGNRQLWWQEAKPGDRLVLELPVEKSGVYRLRACLTKAVDYGIVRITIGGKTVQEALDRFNPEVQAEVLDLGTLELSEGTNRIEIEITGSNEKAVKKYMFGLDYFLLEK